MRLQHVSLSISGNKMEVTGSNSKKKTRAIMQSTLSHAQNLIKGASGEFTYKMVAVHSHFPMTVKVEGKTVFIKNYTGLKLDRKARIMGETKVEVRGKEVIVTGHNLEEVSQTASNIERACKPKGKDIRVFQDGVYLTETGFG